MWGLILKGAGSENSVLFHYPFNTACEPQFHCLEAAGTFLLSRMEPVAQIFFTYLYTAILSQMALPSTAASYICMTQVAHYK